MNAQKTDIDAYNAKEYSSLFGISAIECDETSYRWISYIDDGVPSLKIALFSLFTAAIWCARCLLGVFCVSCHVIIETEQ